jgi:transcriptional regulator with XRE-family HTH domain
MPTKPPKPCPQRARFGKNIAGLRKERKYTQERLAELAGISARYLQSVEAGEYFPALPTLARIKIALHCSWNEIFNGCERI